METTETYTFVYYVHKGKTFLLKFIIFSLKYIFNFYSTNFFDNKYFKKRLNKYKKFKERYLI